MAQQAAPSAAPQQRTPPDDQVDGDLSECVKGFNKLLPAGVHQTSVLKAWAAAGDHEEFVKLATAANQFKAKLETHARLSDDIANVLKTQANEQYSSRNFNAAIATYTRALMSAASPSVIAVIVNNRAAVLLEQGLPLAALLDAHHACRMDPSFAKAYLRRGKCLEQLGFKDLAAQDAAAGAAEAGKQGALAVDAAVIETSVLRPTQIDDTMDATFTALQTPLLSDCRVDGDIFSVNSLENKGKHVVAKTFAAAGRDVLVERPFASVVRSEGLLCSCAFCHKQTSCLYPCKAHVAAGLRSRGLFCSEACAAESWDRFGKIESQNVFWLACSVDALLAFRIVTRANALRSDDDATRSRLDQLKTWSKEVHSGAGVGGHETAVCCAAIAFLAVDAMLGDAYRNVMRQITCNARSVSFIDRISSSADPKQPVNFVKLHVGKALYLGASYFNHSCLPNAFEAYHGNPHRSSAQLHVRLIRPLAEGEEITVAYDGISKHVNHSTRARIRDLRAKWGFACTCTACFNEVDEPITPGEQEHYVKAADYYQKGRRLMREGDLPAAAMVLSQSLEIVMRYICPPPKPPQFVICKTHDAIAQVHMLQGDRAKCVEHLELALKTMIALQGPDSLDLAQEYRKISSLYCRSGDSAAQEKAKQAAEEAIRLLSLHYPPSRALASEVALLRHDLELGPDAA